MTARASFAQVRPRTARAMSGLPQHRPEQDDRVEILSREQVPQKKARELAQREEQAFRFAIEQSGYDPSDPAFQGTVKLTLLSDQEMAKFGDPEAITLGPGKIDVRTKLDGPRTAMAENDLAHENVHNVAELLAKSTDAPRRLDLVPSYVQEGMAWAIACRYPGREGLNDIADLETVRGWMKDMSAREAKTLLAHFRTAKSEMSGYVNRGEAAGALYVEFLITRLNGQGRPDTLNGLGRVQKAVIDGTSYRDAFQREFGVTAAESERQFLAFMKQTEGHPRARFAGTLYAYRSA